MIVPSTCGFSVCQAISSVLVTVMKSPPRNTRATPGSANSAVASGLRAAVSGAGGEIGGAARPITSRPGQEFQGGGVGGAFGFDEHAANASKMRRDTGSVSQSYSGCHCIPTAKPGALTTRTASIWPSGAIPSATRPGRKLVDALVVQRVHRDLGRAGDPVQPASRGHPHARAPCPGAPGGRMHRRRVVDPVGQVLQPLVQRAAERHVQLLEAAADRQQRHAAGDRGADQRQRRAVARGSSGVPSGAAARHTGWAARSTGCRSG
jgi:hypothetical protein